MWDFVDERRGQKISRKLCQWSNVELWKQIKAYVFAKGMG